MKTILLTGGSSFIGKNILESYLSKKYIIYAPSHKEIDFTDEDMVYHFFNVNQDIEIILHVAFANDLEKDLRMYSNIIRYRPPETFLYNFSSGSIYDNTRAICNVSEIDILTFPVPKLSSAYGKYLMYELSKNSKMIKNICHLAIFGIFGKYEKPHRFITYSFNRLSSGYDIQLDGIRKMSFIYIKDFIKVIDKLCEETSPFNLINIAYDDVYLADIAQYINGLFGREPIDYTERKILLPEYTASTKLLESLHYCEPTSIYDAITDYYTIWRKDV